MLSVAGPSKARLENFARMLKKEFDAESEAKND